jgi:hypothetical protein
MGIRITFVGSRYHHRTSWKCQIEGNNMIIETILFFLVLALGLICVAFGLRLASDCADLKADLPDYVYAINMLGIGMLLLVAAYKTCPFNLVLIWQ